MLMALFLLQQGIVVNVVVVADGQQIFRIQIRV